MQCNDVGAELPTFTHHVDIIAHTVHVTICTMHNGYDSIYKCIFGMPIFVYAGCSVNFCGIKYPECTGKSVLMPLFTLNCIVSQVCDS